VTASLSEPQRPSYPTSVKLARRVAMRQEARLVENEFFKGGWSTELDFAILKAE
jgi:RimJ/RimL family protein N-acetyltransferase